VNGEVFEELMSTGAVVAGRGTFEPAGGWGGDHHDGVPIFILCCREPGVDIERWPLVTPVKDVTSAMTLAKQAGGEKSVLVHGARVAGEW
jgi:dihydrofolate reductase